MSHHFYFIRNTTGEKCSRCGDEHEFVTGPTSCAPIGFPKDIAELSSRPYEPDENRACVVLPRNQLPDFNQFRPWSNQTSRP